MGKEILAIPEESLPDVIEVIRYGLALMNQSVNIAAIGDSLMTVSKDGATTVVEDRPEINESTTQALLNWCNEMCEFGEDEEDEDA